MDSCDWDSIMQFDGNESEPSQTLPDFSKSAADPVQIPTPPLSNDGSPICDDPSDDENILVSVSTTFFPGAKHHTLPPDLVLLSSDSVFFYVHSGRLLAASSNGFRELLANTPTNTSQSFVITVPETAAVLNIILHAIYEMSCAEYCPDFSTLVSAVKNLPVYGVLPLSIISPKTPLYTQLLSHAPLFPLELYSLAASFDLYDLAVSASPHLLSYQLSNLTDDIVMQMGPLYLKRLFFLHIGRTDALKRNLLSPPSSHPPTANCDFTEQRRLTRAWTLAAAYLAWDARPDLSTNMIDSTFRPLSQHLDCELCKETLSKRVNDLITQWSIVKARQSICTPKD